MNEWFPETDQGRTTITRPGLYIKAIVELNIPEDCFAFPALPWLPFPLLHFFLEAIFTSLRANVLSRPTFFFKLSCVGCLLRCHISGLSVILPLAFWNLECQERTLHSSRALMMTAGVGEFPSMLSWCHSFLHFLARGFLFHSNVLAQPVRDLSLVRSV